MWIDRVFSLTPTGTLRKTVRHLKTGFFLTCLVLSLTACAQQSDLVKVEKDLGGKITKLDQEKKALAQVLKQAKQEMSDALEEQKAEFNKEIQQARAQLNDEVLKARAQLNSEMRSLREENLPKVVGDLETQLHGLRNNLEKKQQQQSQQVSDQFVAFQGSLSQFEKAMAGVQTRLEEEGQRATSAETKLRRDFDKRLQAFGAKLVADTQALKTYLETEVKTAIEAVNDKMGTELAGLRQTETLHGKTLEEVTLSLTQLRDVLGTTGTQLGTKLDSQGKGLEQTATRVEQLQRQYAALAKKLDADMKGLHGYLDKDVRPSLASIAKAVGEEKNRVSQEFTKFKAGLQRVEQTTTSNVTHAKTQLDAQAKHVQKLGETVAGMREVMDSMAGMLGNRTDQHMNQLGQLTARLAQLEKEQSSEAAKQASNTQAVSTHLNEVTASVQSIGQSFEQFKGVVSTKLNEQADRLQAQAQQMSKATAASSDVTNLQQGLQANVTQLNDLTQSVSQLKDVVKTMGTKLGSKVDTHESQLNKLQAQAQQVSKTAAASSDVTNLQQGLQANVTQLNDLTQSVSALKDVVGTMGKKLGSKVDAHESQLTKQAAKLQSQAKQASKALGASSAVPDLQQDVQANVTQLNELTQSIAALSEAVRAMSEKLDSKVEAYDSQLLKLEKAVNMFK